MEDEFTSTCLHIVDCNERVRIKVEESKASTKKFIQF